MSDRFIPRTDKPQDPSKLEPTTPRARHLIQKTEEYVLVADEYDPYKIGVDIWRLYQTHSICGMSD